VLFKKEIHNSELLWVFVKAAVHIISIDQLVKEAEHVFAKILPPDLVKKNLEAMRQGYELGDVI
jgi:Pyruvate/2-oxoacid:ferredoxin oxidoreductase gamma subunit